MGIMLPQIRFCHAHIFTKGRTGSSVLKTNGGIKMTKSIWNKMLSPPFIFISESDHLLEVFPEIFYSKR